MMARLYHGLSKVIQAGIKGASTPAASPRLAPDFRKTLLLYKTLLTLCCNDTLQWSIWQDARAIVSLVRRENKIGHVTESPMRNESAIIRYVRSHVTRSIFG